MGTAHRRRATGAAVAPVALALFFFAAKSRRTKERKKKTYKPCPYRRDRSRRPCDPTKKKEENEEMAVAKQKKASDIRCGMAHERLQVLFLSVFAAHREAYTRPARAWALAQDQPKRKDLFF